MRVKFYLVVRHVSSCFVEIFHGGGFFFHHMFLFLSFLLVFTACTRQLLRVRLLKLLCIHNIKNLDEILTKGFHEQIVFRCFGRRKSVFELLNEGFGLILIFDLQQLHELEKVMLTNDTSITNVIHVEAESEMFSLRLM
jgi:hypothetical protein